MEFEQQRRKSISANERQFFVGSRFDILNYSSPFTLVRRSRQEFETSCLVQMLMLPMGLSFGFLPCMIFFNHDFQYNFGAV